MAQKHGLDDNVKVGQFSLLTTVNPNTGRRDHPQKNAEDLDAAEKKERLAEYHRKVNERRKIIAKKAEEKRIKEAKELEAMTDEEKRRLNEPKSASLQKNKNVMPSLKH